MRVYVCRKLEVSFFLSGNDAQEVDDRTKDKMLEIEVELEKLGGTLMGSEEIEDSVLPF